ncbi:sigma 54-interacting transcriptional regulator [Pendulispora albinea]|uniref:Sigma-54 dependent transcriptional regulator n=1 Tax=Pendulispora albinea TaxID=2741071 RepID=A0ABZ2M0U7_9BACT
MTGLRIGAVHHRGDEAREVSNTTLRDSLDVPCPPTEAPTTHESRFGSLLGQSTAMLELFPIFEKLARSDVPVLVEGETGTGKEVLAEAIHEASGRTGPFIVFDCTTVTESLFEAELFGHERGAFTGADRARTGIFEEAHGGTLFIDEIGDLAVASQAKLLRVLERRQVRRVGGNGHVHVDVRVIAATRRDLELEVQERRFRDDLFFRLAVARVELPPLRKRQGDIELLTRSFWSSMGGKESFPATLLQQFENYDWPGNVRELRNVIARYRALGNVNLPNRSGENGAAAGPEGFDWIDQLVSRALPLRQARAIMTSELERRYVKHMLQLHEGDMEQAAKASGVGRRYFQMLRTKT